MTILDLRVKKFKNDMSFPSFKEDQDSTLVDTTDKDLLSGLHGESIDIMPFNQLCEDFEFVFIRMSQDPELILNYRELLNLLHFHRKLAQKKEYFNIIKSAQVIKYMLDGIMVDETDDSNQECIQTILATLKFYAKFSGEAVNIILKNGYIPRLFKVYQYFNDLSKRLAIKLLCKLFIKRVATAIDQQTPSMRIAFEFIKAHKEIMISTEQKQILNTLIFFFTFAPNDEFFGEVFEFFCANTEGIVFHQYLLTMIKNNRDRIQPVLINLCKTAFELLNASNLEANAYGLEISNLIIPVLGERFPEFISNFPFELLDRSLHDSTSLLTKLSLDLIYTLIQHNCFEFMLNDSMMNGIFELLESNFEYSEKANLIISNLILCVDSSQLKQFFDSGLEIDAFMAAFEASSNNLDFLKAILRLCVDLPDVIPALLDANLEELVDSVEIVSEELETVTQSIREAVVAYEESIK